MIAAPRAWNSLPSDVKTADAVNPLIPTLKPQSNGPSYSNIVIGTLAVEVYRDTGLVGRGSVVQTLGGKFG